MKYATRVNSFLSKGYSLEETFQSISRIDGVGYVDLNYPEHFEKLGVQEVKKMLLENNLQLNAINLRFRDYFLQGVFTNNENRISEEAVELCKEAAKVCKELGGKEMILWLSFDGYDYIFQADYSKSWEKIKRAIKEICEVCNIPTTIEYKPYEERVHTFMDSYASTLLMVEEVGSKNLGVTIDLCHMLMKKESPAMAAAILLSKNKLFSVHLNDGEGYSDDGLMVGAVHPFHIFELFYYLKKYDFSGVIYFDTFPKREDPKKELEANVLMVKTLENALDRIGVEKLTKLIESGDATETIKFLSTELLK